MRLVCLREPQEASLKEIAHAPVSLENINWVSYHPFNNLDNTQFFSMKSWLSKKSCSIKKKGEAQL